IGSTEKTRVHHAARRRSSRVAARGTLTCSCRSARVELAGRAADGALLRLGFVVLPCCGFADLRLIVRCRLIEPSPGPTTIRYHNMRPVVHHTKIRRQFAAMGHPRSLLSKPYVPTRPLRPESGSAGRPMAGFIIVEHAGLADDADLSRWLQMVRDYRRDF